jgi:hypothetical protein
VSDIRIRSEGALDLVEDAIRRYEKIEKLLELPIERMQYALPSAEVDAAAIERLEKLDPETVRKLADVRSRVAEATRAQLRERDIEPTALRAEDLLAQLVARANVARISKETPRPSSSTALRIVATQFIGAGLTWWLSNEHPGAWATWSPIFTTTLVSVVLLASSARNPKAGSERMIHPAAMVPIAVMVVALLVLTDASWLEISASLGCLGFAALMGFLSRRPRD